MKMKKFWAIGALALSPDPPMDTIYSSWFPTVWLVHDVTHLSPQVNVKNYPLLVHSIALQGICSGDYQELQYNKSS